ncbi:MAG: hypothetical protein A2682_03335 [Candidatus Terrybacteria bacterium RIFCSPHIGHO2_01_FULL_58_15]|uniref:Response regulatory domain-containing protein n=1 Tax=Terrybacteria sp. (strain RIFCSPHIGHO2_01_FULL_58_15) TaxID=1802363 RepID=A0A1G2PP52_TERXR|nr:MAG: hypothetical protein A2682_03335 [Candidatus Terrybacteria bacterium RIFCSPHIGHO2_01_FULL_58_15]
MPENPTPSSSPHILLVEDDVFLVRAYEAILSSEGYQVHVVADGEAALKTLAEEPLPAVILLDLMLPHKSGFEVLEAIGKDPRLAAVPVLVLSNLAQQVDVERAKALGAKEYFVKADTPLEQVVEAIKRYLPNGK